MTEITRREYRRDGPRYASELTEEECVEIENELLQRLMYRRG